MRILRSIGLTIFAILITIPLSSPASSADESARILHFPPDYSMGQLFVREFGKTGYHPWQRAGDAIGEVKLPENMERRLSLSREGCADLSPLSSLTPDDLYELSFPFFPSASVVLSPLEKEQLANIVHLSPLKYEQLAHLSHLTSLKTLRISGNPVTDAGLTYLSGLALLEELELQNAGITDKGLIHLEKLTSLRTLWISGNPITDEGIAHIKNLPRLESLVLSETQITDAGFVHLAEMTSLRKLYLNETDTSPKPLARLRQELPNATIYSQNTNGTDDVFFNFSLIFLVAICALMLALDQSFTRGKSWELFVLLAGAACSLLFLATVLPLKIYNLRYGQESLWWAYLQIIGLSIAYGIVILFKLFFEESFLSRMFGGISSSSAVKGLTATLALALGYATYWLAVVLLTDTYYHGDYGEIFFVIVPLGIGVSILGGVAVGIIHMGFRIVNEYHAL